MIAAAVIASLVAAAGACAALWIRELYGRIAALPEISATLKTTADRRDELARDLALERSAHLATREQATKLAATLSGLLGTMRRETDAKIDDRAGDAAAQLELANELLERPWPGDGDAPGAGAAGDRKGDAAARVRAPTAADTPSARGRSAG